MNGTLTIQRLGIGALAGATTALLCVGFVNQSLLALLLYMISPVPLMVAGLGFGLSSALAGAFAAVAVALAMTNGLTATFVALAIAAPACAASYWLNLARPAEEIGGPRDMLAWFPLADVFFSISLLTGFAYVLIGARIGFGPELTGELAAEMARVFRETDPQAQLSAEGIASLQRFIEVVIPVAQPFVWMLTLAASIYLALAVARRSGLIRRPKDDWPAGLRMPRVAVLALLAAILISFAPGALGSAASVFVGALGAGFVMAGYAMLHERTRGNSARTPLIVFAYLCTLLLSPVLLFFLIAGLAGAGRQVPLSPATQSSNTNHNPND
ncbi:DUF2232 domain-containing protein [Oricola sp.]|uniref:DUF2232 domain-containing protein n=1 Tax=Oricola sp. TaxID=1979950 RepID=UPI003BA8F6E5